MKYWTRPHNLRYEVNKRIDKLLLEIAHRMPKRLKRWVVVDVAAKATTGKFADRTPDQVSCLDMIGVV